MNLSFGYNPLLIVVCLLLAAVGSWWGYRNIAKDSEIATAKQWLLASLRFATVFLVSFLLLYPVLESEERKVEQPVVAVLVDNTSSVLLKADSTKLTQQLADFTNQLQTTVGGKANVQVFAFDEAGITNKKNDFEGKSTNISQALNAVNVTFDGANIGAIVVASDGIANEGLSPASLGQNSAVPIFALGIGDSSEVKDVQVDNVLTNKVVYLGNKTPFIVQIKAKQLANASAEIKLLENGKLLQKETFTINSNSFFREFNFQALPTKKGFNKYTISVSPLDGEQSVSNNSRVVVVEAVENKRKVALIVSAPHPDVNAVSLGLQQLDNLEVVTVVGKTNVDVIDDYDGFFYFPYGPMGYNETKFASELIGSGKPLFLFIGPNTDLNYFNKTRLGFSIEKSKGINKVHPRVNKGFELFAFENFESKVLRDLAPVEVAFGEYKLNPGTQVLMYQDLGGLKTEFPLLGFFQQEKRRVGVCFAEGIWQWRMNEFYSTDKSERFDKLFQQSLQYLFANYNKKNFVVSNEAQYNETDEVKLSAELYDASFSFLPGKDISLTLSYEDSVEFNFLFDKAAQSYALDAGRLSPGKYTYKAEVEVDGKMRTENGVFYVNQINKEALTSVADFAGLRKMAAESGGQFAIMDDATKIVQSINQDESLVSVSYLKSSFNDLAEFKLYFLLILVLVSAEWLIRKLSGLI